MRIGIVGAGPVGLAAALLLRRQGLDPVVFERRDGLCELPQAHVINTRTSEILREIGVFDRVVADAAAPEKIKFVTWSESLGGRRFGRLPYQGGPDDIAFRHAASPARTVNIGQDRLERHLFAGLDREGGHVEFGSRIVGAWAEGGRAVLQVASQDGEHRAEFDLVLACDGANSLVRQNLGIEMEGPPSIARFASAYFEADLSSYLGADAGPVNFIAGQDVRGVIIGFDMERTWAFMCVMAPDASPADFPAPVMEALVRRAVGDPGLALKLKSVGSWNMSAQVAMEFQQGPFLLVGDAAHRFPPTGGLGVNTGIADAHNLAWKIGAIARGEADFALLGSYGPERRPIACRNRDHSVSNAMKMVEVDEAIGLSTLTPVDPTVVERPWSASAPHPADQDDTAGLVTRAEIQRGIDNQRAHFDSLALEIGYAYGEEEAGQGGHGQGGYAPRLQVGALLPHAWLGDKSGRRSTLDLLDPRHLVLLAADAPAWTAVVDRLESRIKPLVLDFSALASSIDPARAQVFAPAARGAVLVRPDGHVAWIGGEPVAGEARGLASALEALAGRGARKVAAPATS